MSISVYWARETVIGGLGKFSVNSEQNRSAFREQTFEGIVSLTGYKPVEVNAGETRWQILVILSVCRPSKSVR